MDLYRTLRRHTTHEHIRAHLCSRAVSSAIPILLQTLPSSSGVKATYAEQAELAGCMYRVDFGVDRKAERADVFGRLEPDEAATRTPILLAISFVPHSVNHTHRLPRRKIGIQSSYHSRRVIMV